MSTKHVVVSEIDENLQDVVELFVGSETSMRETYFTLSTLRKAFNRLFLQALHTHALIAKYMHAGQPHRVNKNALANATFELTADLLVHVPRHL